MNHQARRLARRACLAMLAVLVALATIVSWPSPASAQSDDDPGEPPAEGCDLEDDRRTWHCEIQLDGEISDDESDRLTGLGCVLTDEETLVDEHGYVGELYTWECPTSTDSRMVECRNERSGPGPIGMPDEHNTVGIPNDAPQWWVDEIALESADMRTDSEGNEEKNEGAQGCELAAHVPVAECADRDLENYEASGLIPDECWGTYPTDYYELSWDDGGWDDLDKYDERVMGWGGKLAWGINTLGTRAALFTDAWAYRFRISDYVEWSTNLGHRYDVELVDGLNLELIAWFALWLWVGVTALRGKLTSSGAEIAMSIVLAVVCSVLFANRADYMNSIDHAVEEAAITILSVGQGQDVDDCLGRAGDDSDQRIDCVLRPLQETLHQEFVERPYLELQWGTELTDDCLDASNHVLSTGYTGDGWPARHMDRAGCPSAANHNKSFDVERFLSTLLIMIVGLIVAAFLILVALTVLLSKFLLLVLFIVLPFATVVAVLPGASRRPAWQWGGTLVELILTDVGVTVGQSFLLVGTDEMLSVTADRSMLERWGMVGMVGATVYFGRRRVIGGARRIGEATANAMSSLTPAGAAANMSHGPSHGIDMLGPETSVLKTAAYGTAIAGPAVGMALGRTVQARLGEWRQDRRVRTRLHDQHRPTLRPRHDSYRMHPATPAGSAPVGGRSRIAHAVPARVSLEKEPRRGMPALEREATAIGAAPRAYWKSVATAEQTYATGVRYGYDADVLKRNYRASVADAGDGYTRATGLTPPGVSYPAPWEATGGSRRSAAAASATTPTAATRPTRPDATPTRGTTGSAAPASSSATDDVQWLARDRWTIDYRPLNPRSPLFHPIGWATDKARQKMPFVGHEARFRRLSGQAMERTYRGHDDDWF